jgi:hypothetical protein
MRLLCAIPILLGAILVPDPARSATAPARLDLPPAEVRAGEVITLRWSDPGPGVEELEILLSLDDGRTFPLRVSTELDAGERSLRWRVPNLPSGAARLRIRAGVAHEEVEGEPTPAFRIVGAPGGADVAASPVHEGGWWERLRAPRGGASASLAGTAPAWGAMADDGPSATCERPLQISGDPTDALASESLLVAMFTPARAPIRHGTVPARVHPRN